MKRSSVFALAALLAACQSLPPARAPVAMPSAGPVPAGSYDNHEQIWIAREQNAPPPLHLLIDVQPTSQSDWTLWRVHLDVQPALEAVWAMRTVAAGKGAQDVIPHVPIGTAATAIAFDPKQWTALPACGLRSNATDGAVRADLAACAPAIAGLGATGALLPTAIEPAGDRLRVRLYADEARGAQAASLLRHVERFAGWAVVNGSGPHAPPGGDWHKNAEVRLGSEGGRYALAWRDGKATGYSLTLERVTYRQGDVAVLKLAVVDDATAQTLAYVWANPDATRIGLNLGWLQVGLERGAAAAAP